MGDFLVSAVNQKTGAWFLSPMASEIEGQTIRSSTVLSSTHKQISYDWRKIQSRDELFDDQEIDKYSCKFGCKTSRSR